MKKPKVIRLERERIALMIREDGNEETPTVYTDHQYLVRELFWRRLDALMALSRPARPGRVLDFGGGNGILVSTLAARFERVDCVDLRAEMAERVAREDGLDNVHVHSAELFGLKLPDATFDTIIAADVLEHLTELEEMIQEFRRLLVPGGELLVSLPSENRFYEFGRKVFGYTKPHDHYHHAASVEVTIGGILEAREHRHWPFNLGPLGVFSLARFVK